MPEKDIMEQQETDKPVQRLCSEIQLFDLCDLERCGHKEGRFCTNDDLLTRFERITEKDETRSYLLEEPEDGEEADDEAFGDEPDDLDDGGRDDWEDE